MVILNHRRNQNPYHPPQQQQTNKQQQQTNKQQQQPKSYPFFGDLPKKEKW